MRKATTATMMASVSEGMAGAAAAGAGCPPSVKEAAHMAV